MKIGNQIKKMRKELKVSQREIGELLGVTQQVISTYERSGSLSASQLEKIAEHYKIGIGFFFTDKSLAEYTENTLNANSLGGPIIPAGWDELLDRVSQMNHKDIKFIETVLRALINEFTK